MPEAEPGRLPLSKSAFFAARHIAYAPDEKLFSFTVGGEALQGACRSGGAVCALPDGTNLQNPRFPERHRGHEYIENGVGRTPFFVIGEIKHD
jgi:hypothetical protein